MIAHFNAVVSIFCEWFPTNWDETMWLARWILLFSCCVTTVSPFKLCTSMSEVIWYRALWDKAVLFFAYKMSWCSIPNTPLCILCFPRYIYVFVTGNPYIFEKQVGMLHWKWIMMCVCVCVRTYMTTSMFHGIWFTSKGWTVHNLVIHIMEGM